jgi:Zn-dependent M28 family amino/carboxypeptidase
MNRETGSNPRTRARRRCAALLVGCAASFTTALARAGDRPEPRAAVEQLVRTALTRGEAYASLQELCRTAPQRLSGSPGLATAEEWALRRMRAIGLENVHAEPCLVPRWVRGHVAKLAVVEPASAAETFLPILALGGSVGTSRGPASPALGGGAPVRGELVVVQSFEELRALGERARGKIVLFDRAMDPGETDPFEAYGKAVDQRAQGAVEAAKAGAVAALVRSLTLRLDDLPHTGSMRYVDGVERIPAAAISTAGAARLAQLARTNASVVLTLALDCRSEEDVEAHNIVGELPGTTHAQEIVVVGGHLDAWDIGQGAHDDGAGCVEALEALRLVRACGLAPRRTLRCVLWTNEENGLRGAFAYKDAHAAELDRHVLAIESDRGGFAPRGFETNATGAAWEALAGIAALLEPYGAGRLVRGGGGADTIPLERAGVNVMSFVPDAARYFDVHHCARDTIESVHPRELELASGVLAALVYCVAELETPLSRPPPPAEKVPPAEKTPPPEKPAPSAEKPAPAEKH